MRRSTLLASTDLLQALLGGSWVALSGLQVLENGSE